MYIRITKFIRQQPNNLSVVIERRQKRDLLAIQRVFINISILLALAVPGVILLIISIILRVEHPLVYRVLWVGAEIAVGIFSIEMTLMTPQIRNIVMKRYRLNRVTLLQGSIKMRPMPTAQ
jgi:hypothetical protein